MEEPTMALLKDLIEIPDHVETGIFVLRLAEGVARPEPPPSCRRSSPTGGSAVGRITPGYAASAEAVGYGDRARGRPRSSYPGENHAQTAPFALGLSVGRRDEAPSTQTVALPVTRRESPPPMVAIGLPRGHLVEPRAVGRQSRLAPIGQEGRGPSPRPRRVDPRSKT